RGSDLAKARAGSPRDRGSYEAPRDAAPEVDIGRDSGSTSRARTGACGMSELKTCFKRVDYDLSALLHYIDIGDIGLPDIQRPFVWSNAKVRDLFDSMYKGFPVG